MEKSRKNRKQSIKQVFKLLVSYIKRHISIIVSAGITIVLFLIVFSLYDLPAEAVLYATVLSIVAVSLFGMIRFYFYYKRQQKLQWLKHTITLSEEEFPQPQDRIEEDYQEIIRILSERYTKMYSDVDEKLSDMMDYYTMWVHQIKTPIAAMRLLLQSEEMSMSEELQDQLFKIEQYVGMVLQYLRVESMSGDLLLSRYDLDDIVKQAIKKHTKSFIRKKITLYYEEIHKKVLTDEKWLVFVIEQLISNALKYTNSGSISIYLDTELEDTLVIEDTGIGICPEDLPRVCEKGYTGYNGRADKKSTGIGLYLCKRILNKLSHTMTITSEVSKGTKVYIGLAIKELIVE
ncbi:sensor histidine kinase [Lachnoclostridium sp.]|uniref:sensor histidine kinase n=1 Tax=Lachnoclostridium sp. TaxID=2028282 RepID=UPI0028978F4E|nr:sensor histidine kinase [Lachnoclostridium sp.]